MIFMKLMSLLSKNLDRETESALKWKWFQHHASGKNVSLASCSAAADFYYLIFFPLTRSNRNIHLPSAYTTYTATRQPFRTHQIRSGVECTSRLIRCVREKLASRGDEVPGGPRVPGRSIYCKLRASGENQRWQPFNKWQDVISRSDRLRERHIRPSYDIV